MKDSTASAGSRIRAAAALAAFAAVAAAFALDNTINNDFWNTTGYVNPSPDTKAATLDSPFNSVMATARASVPAVDERFDSVYRTVNESAPLERFRSDAPGLALYFK